MSYLVTIITTIPSSSTFYAHLYKDNLDKAESFQIWTETCPGFIKAILEMPDENTAIQTYEWATEADYENWWESRWDHIAHQERLDYNYACGITSSITNTIK